METPDPPCLLLAADEGRRAFLRSLLECTLVPGWEVREAGSCAEALSLLQQGACSFVSRDGGQLPSFPRPTFRSSPSRLPLRHQHPLSTLKVYARLGHPITPFLLALEISCLAIYNIIHAGNFIKWKKREKCTRLEYILGVWPWIAHCADGVASTGSRRRH